MSTITQRTLAIVVVASLSLIHKVPTAVALVNSKASPPFCVAARFRVASFAKYSTLQQQSHFRKDHRHGKLFSTDEQQYKQHIHAAQRNSASIATMQQRTHQTVRTAMSSWRALLSKRNSIRFHTNLSWVQRFQRQMQRKGLRNYKTRAAEAERDLLDRAKASMLEWEATIARNNQLAQDELSQVVRRLNAVGERNSKLSTEIVQLRAQQANLMAVVRSNSLATTTTSTVTPYDAAVTRLQQLAATATTVPALADTVPENNNHNPLSSLTHNSSSNNKIKSSNIELLLFVALIAGFTFGVDLNTPGVQVPSFATSLFNVDDESILNPLRVLQAAMQNHFSTFHETSVLVFNFLLTLFQGYAQSILDTGVIAIASMQESSRATLTFAIDVFSVLQDSSSGVESVLGKFDEIFDSALAASSLSPLTFEGKFAMEKFEFVSASVFGLVQQFFTSSEAAAHSMDRLISMNHPMKTLLQQQQFSGIVATFESWQELYKEHNPSDLADTVQQEKQTWATSVSTAILPSFNVQVNSELDATLQDLINYWDAPPKIEGSFRFP